MPSYVVTGASRGLGYGWAKHLAAIPNNTVFAIVRNVEATKARLSKDGVRNIHVLSADVTDHKALQTAASAVEKVTGGALDVLIHNAALVTNRNSFRSCHDTKQEELAADLTTFFDANVIGTAHVINTFLPLVRKGKEKKVVLISSGMADVEMINEFEVANAVPYSVSKAASNVLVAKYNAALGKKEGTLFMSISPGLVDTSEGKQPTAEELEGLQAMGAKFKAYEPSFTGPITVEQSVKLCMDVINGATVEKFGGAFVSQHGNQRWL